MRYLKAVKLPRKIVELLFPRANLNIVERSLSDDGAGWRDSLRSRRESNS